MKVSRYRTHKRCRGFSFVRRCQLLGIEPGPALATANAIVRSIPGTSIRTLNPLRMMDGIHEG